MISEKALVTNGTSTIYSADFEIKSEDHCNVLIAGVIQSSDTYDVINNAIVFHVAPVTGQALLLRVGTTESDLASAPTDIGICATNITSINSVAGNATNINAVNANSADVTTVATNIASVNTTATNIADVTAVAGNETNINSAVANATNINAVVADASDIGIVAANIANVNTAAGDTIAINAVNANSTNINAAVANATNINAVVADASDIGIVVTNIADVNTTATNIASVNTTATNIASVNTVAGNTTNVNTVAGVSADITTVATNIAKVSTVATDIAKVIKVADDLSEAISEVETVANDLNEAVSEIDTVAASITNVNTVGTNIANVNTVAGISSDVTTVAADATDIGIVAAANTNIGLVGGSITNVNEVATNIGSVNAFGEQYRVAATAPTTSLDAGDLWFDTTTGTMKVYDGSGFVNAGSSVNGIENSVEHIVVTAGQTSFAATYDAGYLNVFLNGVKLDSSDYTATDGANVVLDTGAALNDSVFVQSFGTFELADHYSKTASDARFLGLAGGTMTGDVSLGDNVKAKFGAGDDLQIYHDGANSIIKDGGAGNIQIQTAGQIFIGDVAAAEAFALFNNDGAVNLYHNNSEKLSTTSTGIDVTGSVTCDGFTSTGIDDNATSTAITIDASENVGIGTTPVSPLTVGDDNSFGGLDNQITAQFSPSVLLNKHAGIAFGTYGGSAEYLKQGIFWKRTGSYGLGDLIFANNPTEDASTVSSTHARMRITSAGNVEVNTGNLVIGTSGKGIDFSATPNITGTTSELLDDYEEGTWSPRLEGSVSGIATYTSRVGTYTKIGNKVHIQGYIATSSIGTMGGVVSIRDMPFVTSSTTSNVSAMTVGSASGLAITAGGSVTGMPGTNSSIIFLYSWDVTTGTSTLYATEWSADGAISFSAEYTV